MSAKCTYTVCTHTECRMAPRRVSYHFYQSKVLCERSEHFGCKHLKIERMQELVFFATWYSHPNYSFQHQAWYLSSFLFTKALTDIKKPNMNSYLLPMLATFLSSWPPPSSFFVAFFFFFVMSVSFQSWHIFGLLDHQRPRVHHHHHHFLFFF